MSRLPFLGLVISAAVVVGAPRRSPTPFAVAETARIRAHLDSAERELRAKDVSSLTPAQRAARLRNLDRLHEYWVRAVFPQNTDFPGERVPYFIDRYGTRCAMAYLIEQSGGGDFVARVAATNNNGRVPEFKHDPELVLWLEANGLTLEEAARVQPAYCFEEPCGFGCACPDNAAGRASAGYKTATGVSIGADVLAVALNSVHGGLARPVTGALGIAAGAAGIAVGAPNFDESGPRRTLGFVNAGVGAASAALGLYRIAHKPPTPSRLSLGPWLDGRGGAGMSWRIDF